MGSEEIKKQMAGKGVGGEHHKVPDPLKLHLCMEGFFCHNERENEEWKGERRWKRDVFAVC